MVAPSTMLPRHETSNLARNLTESLNTCTRTRRRGGVNLYSTQQSSGSQAPNIPAWVSFLCERINFLEMDHFVAVSSVYVQCQEEAQGLMK